MNDRIEKVKGIRDSWKVSTIRALCIQEHWFYHGGEAQYNKMFELLKQNDFRATATAIWLCSDTELSIEQIEGKIINELYETAVEMEIVIE
jgi:hypothetical protein